MCFCLAAAVPRLGSSVAQLSLVPVGWTHPQEVSHLDTRSASGHIQKVGSAACRTLRDLQGMLPIPPFIWLLLRLLLLHRLWECTCQADEDVYGYIMQQADVSALRLLEALVVTLPETLLHTYVLICTDIGIKSPGNPEITR